MKIKNRMTNSVDPDGTAHDEPFDLDLHYLQKYLSWSMAERVREIAPRH